MLTTKSKQNGMTFWGLMMVAAVFAFFVLLFFKLFPSYMEHAKVKTALENISRQPGTSEMEKAQIKAAFERRFDIEDVNNIDLNKNLFVEKKPGSMSIRIAYERRVPIAYNVSALIEFDDSVQVNVR
jgi:Tfp pilus assembly major pilin PilA